MVVKDRTQETAEIEPTLEVPNANSCKAEHEAFKFEKKLLPRCMPHRSSAQKVYKVCKIPRRFSIATRSYVTIF